MKTKELKELSRMYSFLSTKELNGIDMDKPESVEKAAELNAGKRIASQERMAAKFVGLAEKTKSDETARSSKNDLDEYRAGLRATDGNIMAALDLFLYNRPDYRAAINSEIEGDKEMLRYNRVANLAGISAYKRYSEAEKPFRALLLTTDDPGAANTVDTTVAQSIIHRAENLGNVMPLLAKISLPFGDYEEPFYNKYATGGYLAETGTVPDFNTELSDATDGIKKNSWVPKDFAFGLEQSFRSLTKLSPAILSDIFKFLSEALERGMELQAINGPGTGVTDNGMILNATSVAFNGNAYLTFVDAKAQLGKARVKRSNLVGFANSEGIGEFEKLAVINEAYESKVISTSEGVTVAGTRIIEVDDTVIPTAANATTVVVGDPAHYLVATTGTLKEYSIDRAELLQRFTTFHVLREGMPRFDDSFAKFTLNV